MSDWTDRLSGVVTRHPRTIVAIFAVVCAVAAFTHSRSGRYDLSYRTLAPQSTPEFAEFEEFTEIFGEENDSFVIGFRADPLLTPDNLLMIDRLTRRLEALDHTRSVTSLTNVLDILGRNDSLDVTEFVESLPPDPAMLATLAERFVDDPIVVGNLISRDASTAAMVVRIAESQMTFDESGAYFDEVHALLAQATREARARSDGDDALAFHMAGYPYMSDVLMHHMLDDTALFIPMTVAIMSSMLWLAFGRVRATWMPLIPVLVASTLALGILTGAGLPMSLLTGQGVLSILILVIGLSDGVHLLNRYDEDITLDPGGDRDRVLSRTIGHVGKACMLTSLTTAIGFIALATADVPSVRDFGIFGAIGIVFAFVGAVVLLPALVVLSERRKPQAPRATATVAGLDRVLAATADLVVRRPRAIAVTGLVVLAAAASAVPSAKIDNRPTRDLMPTDPAVRALHFLEDNLGGAYPLDFVVDGGAPDAIKNPQLLADMDAVRAGIEALPFVSKVNTPVAFIKKMNRAMHDGLADAYRLPPTREAVAQYLLLFEMAGSDAEFDRLVNHDYSIARMTAIIQDVPSEVYWSIVDEVERLEQDRFGPGVDVHASGEGPVWRSAAHVLISTLIRSLYLAMPLIFVITAIAFRSARLGLLSALPNVLPITIGLGLLWPLGIDLRFSTIVAFPVAFGLAVDDTIHFLARYRSELTAGKSPEDAVRATIATTGRAMLLTSVLLVAGFSVLFVSNFLAMIHIAVLISIILITALGGDLLLLPALLLLLGPRPERS